MPPISMRDDSDAVYTLQRLWGHLPEPERLRETHGTGAGVTSGFQREVDRTAHTLAVATRTILQNLQGTESTLRAALNDLRQTEAQVGFEVTALLALLDAAAEQPPTPAPASARPVAPAPPSAPSPGTGNDAGVYG